MNIILTEILSELMPTILQMVSAVLGVLLIRLSSVAKSRWGIEVEARHREALHSALMSGIRAALARGLTGHDIISAAVEHAAKSVPDAIEALAPADGVILSIAEAKLREAVDQTPWMRAGLDLAREAAD